MAPSLPSVSASVASEAKKMNQQDKQPSPSPDPVHTIHPQHASSDQTAEPITQLLTDEQTGIPLSKLSFGIPSREEIQNSGKEDGFGSSEKHTDTEERGVRLDGAGTSGDCSPYHDLGLGLVLWASALVSHNVRHSRCLSSASVCVRELTKTWTRQSGDDVVARKLERDVPGLT